VGGIYAESPSTLGFVLPAGEESFRQLDEVFAPPRMNPKTEIAPTQLSPEEQQEGFSPLFDGQSFLGWALTGEPGCWAVQDGEIRWLQPGGRYLLTRRRFKDFILRFEWKIEEGGNSGVFLRMPLAGRQSRIGMEFQLLGDYGEEPHENGTGSIYDVVAPSQNAAKPAGEWNTAEVVCDGPYFRATINGVQVQDTNLDNHPVLKHRLKEGFIGLQDHGNPVAFRGIRIKELG